MKQKRYKLLFSILLLSTFFFFSCDGKLPTSLINELTTAPILNEPLTIDGSQSHSSSITNQDEIIYHWKIELKPQSSNLEIPENYSKPTLDITPDAPGKYVLSLIIQVGEQYSEPSAIVIRINGYGFENFAILFNGTPYDSTYSKSNDENFEDIFSIELPKGDYSSLIPIFTVSQGTAKLITDILNPTAGIDIISNTTLLNFSTPIYIAVVDDANVIQRKAQIIVMESGAAPPSEPIKLSVKDIIDFYIDPSPSGNPLITESYGGAIAGSTIYIDIPVGVDLNNLKCRFTLSGGTATIGASTLTSGDIIDAYPNPAIKVTAEDGSIKTYSLEIQGKLHLSMMSVPQYSSTSSAILELGSSPGPTPDSIAPFKMSFVEIPYSLWYEVRQWAENEKGYIFSHSGQEGISGNPGGSPHFNGESVQNISFEDAVIWCNALSQRQGLTPAYYVNNFQYSIAKSSNFSPSDWDAPNLFRAGALNSACVKWDADGYRLPTLTEWEYVARFESSNTIIAESFTNIDSQIISTDNQPNVLNIFSMATAPAEYCWDWMPGIPYETTDYTIDNPTGINLGATHLLAGNTDTAGRSSLRGVSSMVDENSGFRIVKGNFAKSFPNDKVITSLDIITTGDTTAVDLSGIILTGSDPEMTTVEILTTSFGKLNDTTLNLTYKGQGLSISINGISAVDYTLTDGLTLSIPITDIMKADSGFPDLLFNYTNAESNSMTIKVSAFDGTTTEYSLIIKETILNILYISDDAADNMGVGSQDDPIKTLAHAFERRKSYQNEINHNFNSFQLAIGDYSDNSTGYDISNALSISGGWSASFTDQFFTSNNRENNSSRTLLTHTTSDGVETAPASLLRWNENGSLNLKGIVFETAGTPDFYSIIRTTGSESDLFIEDCHLLSSAITGINAISIEGSTELIYPKLTINRCRLTTDAQLNAHSSTVIDVKTPAVLYLFNTIIEVTNATAAMTYSKGVSGQIEDMSLFYNNSIDSGDSLSTTGIELTQISSAIEIFNNLIYSHGPSYNKGINEIADCDVLYQNNGFDFPNDFAIYNGIDSFKGYNELEILNSTSLCSDNYDFPINSTVLPLLSVETPWIYSKNGLDLGSKLSTAGIADSNIDYTHQGRSTHWSLGAIQLNNSVATTTVNWSSTSGNASITCSDTAVSFSAGKIALPIGKIVDLTLTEGSNYELAGILVDSGDVDKLIIIKSNLPSDNKISIYAVDNSTTQFDIIETPVKVPTLITSTGVDFTNTPLAEYPVFSTQIFDFTTQSGYIFYKWTVIQGDVTISDPYDKNAEFYINSDTVQIILNIETARDVPNYFVDLNASGNDTGETWGNAINDLNKALFIANRSTIIDHIYIAEGVYKPTNIIEKYGNGNENCSFYITKDITIEGGYPSGGGTAEYMTNPTVFCGDIDGDDLSFTVNTKSGTTVNITDVFTNSNWSDNVLHVVSLINETSADNPRTPITVEFDNIIITGGSADTVANTDYIFYSHQGGGINTTYDVDLTVKKSYLAGNRANGSNAYGGAIFLLKGTTARIENTIFEYNRSSSANAKGGAINSYNHTHPINQEPNSQLSINELEIINCLFYNNNSAIDGGGLYTKSCDVEITNSTFFDNRSDLSSDVQTLDIIFGDYSISNSIFRQEESSLYGPLEIPFINDEFANPLNFISYSLVEDNPLPNGKSCINGVNHPINPFVDDSNPRGDDNIWGTLDDGLRVHHLSEAWDKAEPRAGSPYDVDITGLIRTDSYDNIGCYAEPGAIQTITFIDSSGSTITDNLIPDLLSPLNSWSLQIQVLKTDQLNQNPDLENSNLFITLPGVNDYYSVNSIESDKMKTLTAPLLSMGIDGLKLFSGSAIPMGSLISVQNISAQSVLIDKNQSEVSLWSNPMKIWSPVLTDPIPFNVFDDTNYEIQVIKKFGGNPLFKYHVLLMNGSVPTDQYCLVSNGQLAFWGITSAPDHWTPECKKLFINYCKQMIDTNP